MLFLQNDNFHHFRWHYSYAFIISSPELKKRQENFEACWSVKKILKPIRALRTFADFYSINPDLHFVSKMIFFKTLDNMKVFHFRF